MNEELQNIQVEFFNVDFSSCVGAHIYLAYTHSNIIYAAAKFFKLTQCPGILQMEALVHLLCYLCDNPLLSLQFCPIC